MKNIVFILIDALRPRNLSMFGYEKETDKNLKEIAKESFLFKNNFSTSNCSIPSLNSLFTGKYPNNHYVIHQLPRIEEIEKFKKMSFWLPSYLKSQGYYTIGVDWLGLWFKKGYDDYEEKAVKELSGFFKLRLIKWILSNNLIYRFGKKIKRWWKAPSYSVPAEKTVDIAISKIGKSQKPFFLFMHFWDTHFPFHSTKYRARGKKDIRKIIKDMGNESQKKYVKKMIEQISLYSMKDIQNKYDLAISKVDKQINRFVKFLKDENLWEETIFVIFADHGWRTNEHGIYFHNYGIYEETVHVPLMIRLPGEGSKEIASLVQTVDVTPTVLDYLGLKTDTKFDGVSLLPLIREGKEVRDKVFLFDGLAENIYGVRTKDKKLIVAKDGACSSYKGNHSEKFEEYDLEKDPGEKENIYSGESELMKHLNKKNL